MKIIELDQGSSEWKELRRIRIGASNSPALCGVHPYRSALDVYEEMVLGKETPVNSFMKHGSETEETVREWANLLYGQQFQPAVVLSDEHSFLMASLDGLSWNGEEMLEIKCPGEKNYLKCCAGDVPIYWEYQLQHQLLVTGLDEVELLVWKDAKNQIQLRYQRDTEIMDKILKACETFYFHNLIEFTPPEE